MPAGSSPESIKDPKLRVEYERAIAANSAKAHRLSKHRDFRIQVGFDERLTILEGTVLFITHAQSENLSEIETSTGGRTDTSLK